MKKFICLLVALMFCMSAVLPVFAAEGEFVPSIEYKDGPTVNDATVGGENVTDSVVITTISDALNGSADIPQEELDALLDLYDKLSDPEDEMSLPLDDDHVILELVDVGLQDNEHLLDEEGATLTVEFDVSVPSNADLEVLVYTDGEWLVVENVVVNDNGTVTVVFDTIGPVVFVVDSDYDEDIPQTGDQVGSNIVLWVSLLALSAVALVAVIVLSKRKVR